MGPTQAKNGLEWPPRQLNRLASTTYNYTSGAVSYGYTYDRYGNRVSQTAPQGGVTFSASYNAATNQINSGGYTYDAAGNMTNDGFHAYTYDAEGNILTVDGGGNGQYVYDALNRRVRVQTSTSTYEYLYDSAGRRTSSWLNPSAGNAGSGNEGRIYWDGRQIAFRAWDGTTYFEQQDWLGTERVRTNYQGTIEGTFFSLPWGDGSSATVGGMSSNQDNAIFAGLDADTNSSGAQMSEHAQFRNYSFQQGRWLAPDPYDGSYDITNPQSLNRYAYVLNNPLSYKDQSGLDCNVVVGGITQTPGTSGTAAEHSFAQSVGGIEAYPYAGGGIVGGALSVGLQGAGGDTSASYVAAAAFTAAAQSGSFNIFAFSGGAQATMSALSLVSPGVLAAVNNVTFLSPSGVSSSPQIGGQFNVLSGDSFLDFMVQGAESGGSTGCGHDANMCVYQQQRHIAEVGWQRKRLQDACCLYPTRTIWRSANQFSNWGYAYLFLYGFGDDGSSVTETYGDGTPVPDPQ